MHEVWLWNQGGYFCLLVGRDGTLGIPQGEKAWGRFAAYAPDELIDQAVVAAYKDVHECALKALQIRAS